MMTVSPRSIFPFLVFLGVSSVAQAAGPSASKVSRELEGKVLAVLKARCVKCHGPAKPKAGLTLLGFDGVARGSENGPVVSPGDLEESVLWLNVSEELMPPEQPLPEAEQGLIRQWIEAGAPGLAKWSDGASEASGHWAFRALSRPEAPPVGRPERVRTEVDRFLQAALEAERLAPGPDADRDTLIRRVSLDLTGLPPTPDEIIQFRADASPDAYERMVDRFLASPHYGERWGKHWLDAAGYADSNGYFSADTDRPLAHRFRDYVVRSFNADKPLDQLVREQLAGDEISGYRPGQAASPGMIDLVEATHYLRNGQDGTDDSVPDNPEAQRIDRYAALEAIVQITANSLLGLTIQCARCHDHKFEPITQEEYYRLQSIFYPAFNPEDWIKPKDRFVFAYLPGEKEEWESRTKRIDAEVAALRGEFRRWVAKERPRGLVRFEDRFDPPNARLSGRWSSTAPGDDQAGGKIEVDSANAPGAINKDGALRVAAGQGAEAWVSTGQAFDWTPDRKGDWVQVTFELVDNKLDEGGPLAERIGYVIAAHDFDDGGPTRGGNLLIDGNPGGPTSVHLDYPGKDSKDLGSIGKKGYEPGHNYGARVTNIGEGRFRLEHMVDWSLEEKSLVLKADDLPDGGFALVAAFGRSFVIDDILVEGNDPSRDRPTGLVRFHDDFDASGVRLEADWSATAPGDDKPAGAEVRLDFRKPPGALRKDGRLHVIVGDAAEGWLSTKQAIDWTPDGPGRSVQVTFDLVDDRLGENGIPAARIGYYIAAHDFDDSGKVGGGNILVDGNPGGPTSLYLDYPGKDGRMVGPIGTIGYVPGRNYGVRVTNVGRGLFRLEHLVDGKPEEGGLVLSDRDLPDGGFGFYYGAGRSFVVDDVVIEADPPVSEGEKAEASSFAMRLRSRSDQLEQAVKAERSGRTEGPGRKIAWVSDRSAKPPEVPLLKRGNYGSPGPAVQPGGLAVLTDPGHELSVEAPESGAPTTGRRLALARWLTEPGSRPAALMARVQANRIWQGHFGVGLVPTSENLGQSGASPSHPELLEYLASALVRSGWSAKSLHRLILTSTGYRQSSRNRTEAHRVDPDDRLLWRYPLRRLDAETIRDAMLAVSGDLDARQGGAYVPTRQSAVGEVVVEEEAPGARRRSIYLQQRRSQTLSMLKVFDAPSIAFICSARSPSTIPLQSLSQLNSEFALARAKGMARRVEAEAGADGVARIRRAFLIAAGREPNDRERDAAGRFLKEHPNPSRVSGDSASQPLTDLCQMLLASNAFLYVE